MEPFRYTPGKLDVLDQLLLPHEETWISVSSAEEGANVIRNMNVRGAPAIGLTALYAFLVNTQQSIAKKSDTQALLKDDGAWFEWVIGPIEILQASRPTAVDLFNMLETLKQFCEDQFAKPISLEVYGQNLEAYVKSRHQMDLEASDKMAQNALKCLQGDELNILTHCNTGGLATGGKGTAFYVIEKLFEAGRLRNVYVNETRPYLQGSRLTAYELMQKKIPHKLITDSMGGFFMAQGLVDAVMVGADRIVQNGDFANKIGTHTLAILAHHYKIPFYVVAPSSTYDRKLQSGEEIEIEYRAESELTHINGSRICPEFTKALNPAFDITPAKFVTEYISDH